MEENRLKSFEGIDYDKKLFEKIYKDTQQLRNKLAFEIDHRRFGVDYYEVLSWFDVKFLFAFRKYTVEGMGPDLMKAHVINALRMFKCRILRKAYSLKNQVNSQTVDIDLVRNYENLAIDNTDGIDKEVQEILNTLKGNLSQTSLLVLEIELNTPEYISFRCKKQERNTFLGIPSNLISEYLGNFPISEIEKSRKEILANLRFLQKEYRVA